MMIAIRPDDLEGAAVRDLLALHLAGMHATSPPGSVFALDASGLRHPDVSVWTAWIGDAIAGLGALKLLGGGAAEVKSMRTHPAHLRKGVAAALLRHIVGEARARGMRRLSLETGSGPAFDPAWRFTAPMGSRMASPSRTTAAARSTSSCTCRCDHGGGEAIIHAAWRSRSAAVIRGLAVEWPLTG